MPGQLATAIRSLTSRLRQVDPDNLSDAESQAAMDLLGELRRYFSTGVDKNTGN